jgi:PKD repeat protein
MCGLDLPARHYTLSQTLSFGAGKTDILITCRDNAGTILWNKTIGSEQFNEYVLDVTIDKDSSLLISGYLNQKANDKEQGLLIKLTADGDLVWARIFEPIAGYDIMHICDAYINRFQNISIAYTLATQISPRPEAGFMELKPSGNTICGGKPFFLKQKKVILPEKEFIALAIPLSMDVMERTVSGISIPATMHTLCADSCTTKANVRFLKTRICKGSTVDFVNTSIDADSIRWVLDGIKKGNGNNYSPAFNAAGNHTVALIAYGALCKDTIFTNILVDDLPVANFSYTQQNLEGTFINLSVGALTDTWQMGDGTEYSSVDAHHYFPQLGTYNVCLIASNVCATDTMCQLYRAEDHSNFTLNAHYNFPSTSPNEWSTNICQDYDGNLVVAMDDNSHGSAGSSVSIMKINREGKILKQAILFNTEISRGKVFALGERGYMVLTNVGAMFMLDLKSTWFNDERTLEGFAPWYALEAANKKDIYVGGFSVNNGYKGAILKRNEYGNKVWAKDLFYASNVFKMAELKNGDLLVYGKSIDAGAYLARIRGTDGSLVWSKSYTCSVGMIGWGMWYDPKTENIYMSGSFTSGSGGFFIIKADANGNLIWQKSMDAPNTHSVSCFLNQYDQLFVCYASSYSTICRLDTAGNLKWVKKYKDPAVGINGHSGSDNYTLCHDGGIAAAGSSQPAVSSNTYATVIKVDTAGNNSTCAVTPFNLNNLAYTIVSSVNGIDSVSNHNGFLRYPDFSYQELFYETTVSCFSNACSDLLKYIIVNQTGPQYTFQPTISSSAINKIRWDFGDGTSSNAYAPVHTYAAPGQYNVCITGTVGGCGNLSYCKTINLIITDATEKQAEEHYLTIFPNPYMGSTTVQYNLEKKSAVTFQVFNAIGQLVKTLQDGEQAAGNYSFDYITKKENVAGLYFLRFTVDGKSVVKRMEEIK